MCSPDNVSRLTKALPDSKVIGEVVRQMGSERVIVDKLSYEGRGKGS